MANRRKTGLNNLIYNQIRLNDFDLPVYRQAVGRDRVTTVEGLAFSINAALEVGAWLEFSAPNLKLWRGRDSGTFEHMKPTPRCRITHILRP